MHPGLQLSAFVRLPSPIHRAARSGQLDVMEVLTEELQHTQTVKAMMDMQTKFGFTALHFACLYGHASIVTALVEKGISTDVTNYRGQTAWDVADAHHGKDSDVINELERLAEAHEALRLEKDRRARRPVVDASFRDDLELDMLRFGFFCINPYDNWEKMAEGAFGVVYR